MKVDISGIKSLLPKQILRRSLEFVVLGGT